MADMITLISSLPAQVVGAQVFSFLYLSTIIRLDCSVAYSSHRSVVQEAISLSTVSISSRQHQGLTDQQKLWSWCVRRSVAAKSVYFSVVHADNTSLLQKLLCNLARPYAVQWELNVYTNDEDDEINVDDEDDKDETYSVINNGAIRNNVSTLGLSGHAGTDFPHVTWEALKSVDFRSTSEQSVLSILLGCAALQKIMFYDLSATGFATVSALRNHAQSLVSLSVGDAQLHPTFLSTVGGSCTNLEKLSIQNSIMSDPELWETTWATEVELLALAGGCRKLKSVELACLRTATEAVLLAFAAHCPELRDLSCYLCSTLTDRLLVALAQSCPELGKLSYAPWAITSPDTVDRAESLLMRLSTCPIQCAPEATPAAMARAVSLLKSVRTLCLCHATRGHVAALKDCTISHFNSIELHGNCTVAAVDTLFIKMTHTNPQLQVLQIQWGYRVTESMLLTLTALCPNMRDINVSTTTGVVAESTLLFMVRSWPQLTSIYVDSNVSFTDAVLSALGDHCPHLDRLQLSANTAVTEAAVLKLSASRRFTLVTLPAAFSPETHKTINDAATMVRRSRGH
jgi:hypothetical protein